MYDKCLHKQTSGNSSRSAVHWKWAMGMDNPLLVLTTTRCLAFFCRENQHFVTGLLNTFLKFNNTRPLYGWVKNIKRCFEGRRKFCKGNKYLICFEFKLLQFIKYGLDNRFKVIFYMHVTWFYYNM